MRSYLSSLFDFLYDLERTLAYMAKTVCFVTVVRYLPYHAYDCDDPEMSGFKL